MIALTVRLRFTRIPIAVRFILAGLLNAGFGYAVFAALLTAGFPSGAALIVAAVAGVAFNFQTSRRMVFCSRGCVMRFVTVYGAVLGANWLALRLLQDFGLNAMNAQALLTLPNAAASFFGQKIFVFTVGVDRP